jgi:hypothetical protein
MRTFVLSIIAAALLLCPATLNASTVVYDNGPINGSIDAWSIATNLYGWEVSDSFTLSAPATLTSADVGLYVLPGDTPSSLTWSFGTSFFDASLGTGTSTPGNTYWGSGFDYYDIYDSTFSLPSISLAAGTYYLSLSGMTTENQNIFWDENDGPSSAMQNQGTGAIGSESFRLYSGTTIPEPGTFAALGFGLASLAGLALRRRKSR